MRGMNLPGRPRSSWQSDATVIETIEDFDAHHEQPSARRHCDHVARVHGFLPNLRTMARLLKQLRKRREGNG
jgi:hypothetical protein